MGDVPRVRAILTAAAAGEPMRAHQAIDVEAGFGIPGDRYATRQGHWSDPRWRDQQLTLVSAEFLARLGLADADLRRNIVTQGVELEDLIGLEFGIGTALFHGQRICAPCGYIERLNARPGLLKSLEGRGGIRVSVERSGSFAVGDEIVVLGAMAVFPTD